MAINKLKTISNLLFSVANRKKQISFKYSSGLSTANWVDKNSKHSITKNSPNLMRNSSIMTRIISFITNLHSTPQNCGNADENDNNTNAVQRSVQLEEEIREIREDEHGSDEQLNIPIKNYSNKFDEPGKKKLTYQRQKEIGLSTDVHHHSFHGMDYDSMLAIQPEPFFKLNLMPMPEASLSNEIQRTKDISKKENIVTVTYKKREQTAARMNRNMTAVHEKD